MEEFLKDTVKIDLYVDVVMTRLNKARYYIDSEIDVKSNIKKDLVSIVHRNLKTLQLKQAALLPYSQHIEDEEYEAMLLTIKRQLFKRCKELGMIEVSESKLLK